MKFIKLLVVLLCMYSLSACEEEYSYPNVVTELTEVETDSQGKLSRLITDRGESYAIGQQPEKLKLVADTLYRVLSVFEPMEEKNSPLHVYSIQPVFAYPPLPIKDFKEGIKTDPVDIQSIWRSGKYLNLILEVQTKDKKHAFHFADDGISTRNDGYRTLNLIFYHDRKDDYEAFTSKYCFSIPLNSYEGKLRKGDKILLHIQTYKEGKTTREFDF